LEDNLLLAVHNGLFNVFTLGLHIHAGHLLYPQAENVPCYNDNRLNTSIYFNPLNAELNPISHLLALLGAHHILHVSRIRVKLQYLQ
jgi:hypothetical protein